MMFSVLLRKVSGEARFLPTQPLRSVVSTWSGTLFSLPLLASPL